MACEGSGEEAFAGEVCPLWIPTTGEIGREEVPFADEDAPWPNSKAAALISKVIPGFMELRFEERPLEGMPSICESEAPFATAPFLNWPRVPSS